MEGAYIILGFVFINSTIIYIVRINSFPFFLCVCGLRSWKFTIHNLCTDIAIYCNLSTGNNEEQLAELLELNSCSVVMN